VVCTVCKRGCMCVCPYQVDMFLISPLCVCVQWWQTTIKKRRSHKTREKKSTHKSPFHHSSSQRCTLSCTAQRAHTYHYYRREWVRTGPVAQTTSKNTKTTPSHTTRRAHQSPHHAVLPGTQRAAGIRTLQYDKTPPPPLNEEKNALIFSYLKHGSKPRCQRERQFHCGAIEGKKKQAALYTWYKLHTHTHTHTHTRAHTDIVGMLGCGTNHYNNSTHKGDTKHITWHARTHTHHVCWDAAQTTTTTAHTHTKAILKTYPLGTDTHTCTHAYTQYKPLQ